MIDDTEQSAEPIVGQVGKLCRFADRETDFIYEERLHLEYEVNVYDVLDHAAAIQLLQRRVLPPDACEVWREWSTSYKYRDKRSEELFGTGAHAVSWTVAADDYEGVNIFESLPGFGSTVRNDFLRRYTQPMDVKTGSIPQWLFLPVWQNRWPENPAGFVEETTGWTPTPFQPFMQIGHLESLLRARAGRS